MTLLEAEARKEHKLKIFMQFCVQLSELSRCETGRNAAIIVSPDLQQVYSIGVNGGAGAVRCLCKSADKYASCIHAEINALLKCKEDMRGAILLCTKEPCISCAAAILRAGITTVCYNKCREGTSRTVGLQLLAGHSVILKQIILEEEDES